MKRYLLFIIFILACEKELDITDFYDDYSEYESGIRIEALILPSDSTAIVRIDKSFSLTESNIFDCTDNNDNWDPLLHDTGSDGQTANAETPQDEDGTENNGMPDCGEPNIDEYEEILPQVHVSDCEVIIRRSTDGNIDECNFLFNENGGQITDYKFNGGKNPLLEDFELVNYGAYLPNECEIGFWSDYEAQYSFFCDCSNPGFGIITSNNFVTLSKPVVFFENFSDTNIEEISNCTSIDCLKEKSTLYDNGYSKQYYPRYSESFLYYASMLPDQFYQAVQFMYDEDDATYHYYHGHRDIGNEFLGNVSFKQEQIIPEFYDGLGNGNYDIGEIFSDYNSNGIWDENEDFIDAGDKIGDIAEYAYKIFTFSNSYKNYYFNTDFLLNDPIRSNLQDQSGKYIMGAFGSMTSEKIDFEIIDCTQYSFNDDGSTNINGEIDCLDETKTHSVCTWYDGVSKQSCIGYEPVCLPANYCGD